MRKLYIPGLIALAATIIGLAWAEQLTFTTYYPAPYGRYREFSTSGKTTLATDEYGREGDNARVGIGTTDPQGILHVAGDTAESGKDARDIILQAESGYPGFNKDGGNIVLLPGEGGGTGVDGKVGIGTTEPGALLDLVKNSPDLIHLDRTANAGVSTLWRIGVGASDTMFLGPSDTAFLSLQADGDIEIISGNLGIGTTSPGEKLEVDGAITVGNTAGENAGTIRWTGTAFEGYNGTSWIPLGGGGVSFGNWVLNPSGYSTGVTAATDGIVCAHTAGDNAVVYGYTPIATLRIRGGGTGVGRYGAGVTFPVRGGDTWKVTGASTVYWLPFGS